MSDVFYLAQQRQNRARQVLEQSGILAAWESIHAQVNLVGSLKTGLLINHRDIDMHVYTPNLTAAESFRAMAQFAENPAVEKIDYVNLINTDEHCIEWHAWYRDELNELWKMDMIHILKGSTYDGYFERVADRILANLTEETKRAILELKLATPESEAIGGIVYYQAVLQFGVRTWEQFVQWRQEHSTDGIIEWMP